MEQGEGSERNPRSSSEVPVPVQHPASVAANSNDAAANNEDEDKSTANNGKNKEVIDHTDPSNTTTRGGGGNDHHYMPMANVTRIMRRALPPHSKISDDAKEAVQRCVSEYINQVTALANQRCHRNHRKTVGTEDVMWALSTLGFDNYLEPLSLFLNKYREAQREPFVMRCPPNYGPPQAPPTPVAVPPAVLVAQLQGQGVFMNPYAAEMNGNAVNFGYYTGNDGGGSTSSGGQGGGPSFDHAQFK